jgi:hypothetical protein
LTAESSTAIPAAFAGVNVSIVLIHFGSSGSVSPRGRSRHCRAASNSSNTPRTILTMLTHSSGAPLLLASAPLAASSRTVPATASPNTQPAMNAGPFTRPCGVASINTTAMIGTGLSATPTPNERTWPIAEPTAPQRSSIG